MMKEAEVDALAMPWANSRVAHLLLVHRMATMEVGDSLKEEFDTDGYDQLMYTQNIETIEPFSSKVMPVKAGRAYTGECINIMVQALQTEDGFFAAGPHCAEHVHQVEARQQESSHSGKEQHCILADPLEENPCGQSSSCIVCAQTP